MQGGKGHHNLFWLQATRGRRNNHDLFKISRVGYLYPNSNKQADQFTSKPVQQAHMGDITDPEASNTYTIAPTTVSITRNGELDAPRIKHDHASQ